jgi:RNA polymerase sigma-70 factor (ECF subfamily)
MIFNLRNIEPVNRLSDEELVTKFANTQKQAYFEELYNRYRHLAYGVCLKMLKDDAESLDVVSEVFKILYIKLPTANVKSFKSYLYAVSRNECIARLRSRKTESIKLSDWKNTENAPQDFMENEALFSHLDGEPSLEATMEKAIERLGDDQRTCIRLFFFNDKSYKEIADQTGYTEKQVKSYLQNGKRNLRILLEKDLQKHTA